MTNYDEYDGEYGLSDEFFLATEEEAKAALEKAIANTPKEYEDGMWIRPEGHVFRCTRDDSWEGISAIGEGDEWCVMDENGDNMVNKDGTWVNVS